MPSSAKAQTTLASWTFDNQYDNSGTSGAVTYTPNATSVGTISGNTESYTFGDSYSNIQPTFIANTGSGTLKAVTGNTWAIGAGWNNQCLRLKPSSVSTITDFEANSGADKHDEYFEATFSATGYCNITLNMAICYTANNADLTNASKIATLHVVYSLDGGSTWTDAYTYVDGGSWWQYVGRNITIPVADRSSVIVRFVRGDGWQDASKTWNLDYLTITGEPLDPAKSAISFTKPADVEGIAPTPQSIDINTSFTIPQNYTLYKEGYTLTGWTDGETTFNVGSAYTMTKTVYELTPIFTPNSKSLDDRTEAVTVKWDLRHNNGVPVITWEKNSGILVSQATINGTTIDVKMAINATDGKFDIVSRGDYCQINSNTIVSIPSVPNVEITIDGWYNTYDYEIGGNAVDQDVAKTVYTYTGSDNPVAIKFVNSAFFNYIQATYPAPETITITPAKKFTTFCSTSALNFTAVDGLEAYVVTGSTNTTITLAKVTDVPASTGLILKKTGSAASYNVPAGSATTLAETNKLVGVTTATTFNAGDYILSNGTFIKGTAGTLAAGKAYLPASNIDTSANILSLDFGGTTDIANLKAVNTLENGKFYNLAGQEVAQPQKGLYIMNGKKVIIK